MTHLIKKNLLTSTIAFTCSQKNANDSKFPLITPHSRMKSSSERKGSSPNFSGSFRLNKSFRSYLKQFCNKFAFSFCLRLGERKEKVKWHMQNKQNWETDFSFRFSFSFPSAVLGWRISRQRTSKYVTSSFFARFAFL